MSWQFYSEQLSAYYMKRQRELRHPERKMRVAFVVQETDDWDKQRTVYEALREKEWAEPFLVLCPTYETTDEFRKKPYGRYEPRVWEYYHRTYGKQVFDLTNIGDIRKLHPDYVFYQLPWEWLRPLEGIHSNDVARHAKVCYLPYAHACARNYVKSITSRKEFFGNVSFLFCSTPDTAEAFRKAYSIGNVLGYQHIEFLGYPAFDTFFQAQRVPGHAKRVMWTPHWMTWTSFLKYRENFLALADRYSGKKFSFPCGPIPTCSRHLTQK